MIIVGAGGFAREALCWVEDAGHKVEAMYQDGGGSGGPVPIVDSLGPFHGKKFVVAVGDPVLRSKLWALSLGCGLIPATAIVHPSAILGHSVVIEPGTIICPMSVITADVRIGRGVIVNLASTIGHDCTVDMFATISPGANISGNCHIGMKAYIGTNSCIREGIRIGEGATVGMGAVVTKDVPMRQVWVGNPAAPIVRGL